MYDLLMFIIKQEAVTGPCEFLVMYDFYAFMNQCRKVTGPCEFLVMYDFSNKYINKSELQDPVNF